MRRGRITVVGNLNEDAVVVPVRGELLLAWGVPTFESDTTRLPGHSVAVLQTA
jgi:maltooligosyltrehalose trehalohydrolase